MGLWVMERVSGHDNRLLMVNGLERWMFYTSTYIHCLTVHINMSGDWQVGVSPFVNILDFLPRRNNMIHSPNDKNLNL